MILTHLELYKALKPVMELRNQCLGSSLALIQHNGRKMNLWLELTTPDSKKPQRFEFELERNGRLDYDVYEAAGRKHSMDKVWAWLSNEDEVQRYLQAS